MTDFALEQKLQLAEKTIEQLRRERDNALARDIHSCGTDCTRAGCVNVQLRRELEEARAEITLYAMQESKQLDAAHDQLAAQALVIEKLREVLEKRTWKPMSCAPTDRVILLFSRKHGVVQSHGSLAENAFPNGWKADAWAYGPLHSGEVLEDINQALASTTDYTKLLAERDAALISNLHHVVQMPDEVFIRLRELAAKIRAGEV